MCLLHSSECRAAREIAGEDVDQAEAAGLHTYVSQVADALEKKETGLRAFLQLSVRPVFDGAGAESYTARLGYLLKLWGDHDFAAVLKGESDAVKREVIRRLDEYAIDQHIRKYPETTALAEHDTIRSKPRSK
jgi:hypothetical protein